MPDEAAFDNTAFEMVADDAREAMPTVARDLKAAGIAPSDAVLALLTGGFLATVNVVAEEYRVDFRVSRTRESTRQALEAVIVATATATAQSDEGSA